jgi:hypothetical protein
MASPVSWGKSRGDDRRRFDADEIRGIEERIRRELEEKERRRRLREEEDDRRRRTQVGDAQFVWEFWRCSVCLGVSMMLSSA